VVAGVAQLGRVREEGAVPAEECLVMTHTRLTLNEWDVASQLTPRAPVSNAAFADGAFLPLVTTPEAATDQSDDTVRITLIEPGLAQGNLTGSGPPVPMLRISGASRCAFPDASAGGSPDAERPRGG
jgi:hypothetical protein